MLQGKLFSSTPFRCHPLPVQTPLRPHSPPPRHFLVWDPKEFSRKREGRGKDLAGQEGSPTAPAAAAAAARGEISTALLLADFPLCPYLLKHHAEENCSPFAY